MSSHFFSNLYNLFDHSSRKLPQNSLTSRFLICIFYFIIWLGNPHGRVRIWSIWSLTEQTFLRKILALQTAFLFIKYKLLLESPTYNWVISYSELHIQVLDIQTEIMFILIKCLCTSYGYELFVTRCRGHELHVNPCHSIVVLSFCLKSRHHTKNQLALTTRLTY